MGDTKLTILLYKTIFLFAGDIMEFRDKQLIKNYILNMNTNMLLAGYNKVGTDWQDIDYIPDYNKFYYICDGEGWLKIGNDEYYPKPGQLFLMPQGVKQSFSTINQNTYTKYWCHFTANIGDTNLFDLVHLPLCIEVGNNKLLIDIFEDILGYQTSTELTSSLMLKASLLRLISFFLDNNIIDKINLYTTDTIHSLNTILDYIENNYDKDISVEDLSKMVHLQPNYFIRMFKKNIGSTPIRYINTRRITEAKRLLNSTNLTMSDICNQIGTNDIHYFSRLFKQYTGFTPSFYKNMMMQMKHNNN